ncbi:MAG: arsenate reductase ArsC [Halobacteriota archaeon]|nr:arsenate reductase ArsC [Halobacteriota archaeon]
MKKKVLFICTHNSARSQMAEGLLRHLYGDRYEVYSAGTEPSSVNPHAVKVMEEIGIDISTHRSKSVNELINNNFDFIVTVCDTAKETCPFFPGGGEKIHKSFEDPSGFLGTEDEIIAGFRRVRDEIRGWIVEAFGNGDENAKDIN